MFISFDRIHERDGQTDGQTPHDGEAALMHNIVPQKPGDHKVQRSLISFVKRVAFQPLSEYWDAY